MIAAPWITDEHEQYRVTVSKFLDDELVPYQEQWRKEGVVGREIWSKASELGILNASVPEVFGGSELPQTFDVVLFHELARRGESGWGVHVHNIVTHYIVAFGTEDQKARWLPGLGNGDFIGAIAMSEPGTGSDLQSVKTKAKRDGNEYVISGSKTFITNGQCANLICVVCKTDSELGAKGISLVLVETDNSNGFRRGRNLEKIGMKSQDTSELFFDEVRVPTSNLLGPDEGKGFYQLMRQLAWERLILAITSLGSSERALQVTKEYVQERKAFGSRIMDFQNTRFKLAEVATQVSVLSAFVNECISELIESKLTAEKAAMAKWWGSETQCKIMDECLQLFGGYGFMTEYPIANLYADARVQKIYGGTNEIMKEIIARSIDI